MPALVCPCRCVPALALLLALTAAALADEPRIPNVRAVAFSPDGKLLAASTGEPADKGRVTVWDLATRRPRFSHNSDKGLPDLAFSPDGKLLAVAGYDRTVKLFGCDKGELRRTLQHPKEARSVGFSPDGKTLATGGYDRTVRLWDLATGAETKVLTGPKEWIYTVEFSADGKLLLAAARDGARLWDAATGQEKHVWPHTNSLVRRALFTPDGRQVLSGGWDGTVRLWDAQTGASVARFEGFAGVDGLAYSPARRLLAVSGHSRSVALVRLELREPTSAERDRVHSLLKKLDDDSYEVREEASKALLEIGYLAEAELRRAAKESPSAEVRLRCRKLRARLLSRSGNQFTGTGHAESLAFSPDGKMLATACKVGTVHLWDVATWKEIARLVP